MSVNNKNQVAIIGIACKLPGGIETPGEFWGFLRHQQTNIGPIVAQRWRWPDDIDRSKTYQGIDKGAFFDDISLFDAQHFNISPQEATFIDPQQRLLLELTQSCFVMAGYDTKMDQEPTVGVFIGACRSGYEELLLKQTNISSYFGTAIGTYAVANRLSYCFGLTGPSLAIDTASSSSLVAFSQAVEALAHGSCKMAIAGGVNVICTPSSSLSYYKSGMLSSDALCRSFDAKANGYVRGEGGAVVLLKPLNFAIEDGDTIYGIVKSAGTNHAGHSDFLTRPVASSQVDLLKTVYAGIDLNTIDYIEAHASGTPVGDPIEVAALNTFFGTVSNKHRCGLGSVKPQIGHLESASGIISLVKVLLGLLYEEMPATLNFHTLNPNIELDNSPFYIVDKHQDWQSAQEVGLLRRAGVSSFGLGGVNAHVVLEEYVDKKRAIDKLSNHVIFQRQSYWIDNRLSERAPVTKTIDSLISLIAKVASIAVDNLLANTLIADLGLDSLMMNELALNISILYDTKVSATLFYAVSDLSELHNRLINIAAKKPSKTECEQNKAYDDIAIIGMAAQLPKSQDIDSLWQNLIDGVDLISEIPLHRPLRKAFVSADESMGGFLKDVDAFDAGFFNITPYEAELMDPQQRLLLQVVWQCMENAALLPETLSGSNTGVFVGVMSSDYQELLVQHQVPTSAYTPIGISHSILANRISYFLNLQGASEAINTACSSSLVAMHRAVMALRSGELDMAFVSGVNLLLSPATSVAFRDAGMLSADCRCKTFDDSADGYVRGEGVISVLIKPLAKAIKDGDPIHAVIKNTVVNHGGKSASLTAPNTKAQAQLITDAYRPDTVKLNQLKYIEAHGTGTELGDPVEINSLKAAFKALSLDPKRLLPDQPIQIGAIKTNLGHLEAAAGLAGLVKCVMVMKEHYVPKNLHFQTVNSHLQLDKSPFCLANTSMLLQGTNTTTGVSSFGFGGVSAHVVLESFMAGKNVYRETAKTYIFPLSAKTNTSLKGRVESLATYLQNTNNSEVPLSDIAYTLQLGRQAMSHKLAIVSESKIELLQCLHEFTTGELISKDVYTGPIKINEHSINSNKDADASIAKAWVNGEAVDWQQLWRDESAKKIHLPHYIFDTKSYWFDYDDADSQEIYFKVPKLVPISMYTVDARRIEGKPLIIIGDKSMVMGLDHFTVYHIRPIESSEPRCYQQVITDLIVLFQRLLRQATEDAEFYILFNETHNEFYGVSGLLKSLAREYKGCLFSLLAVNQQLDQRELASCISTLSKHGIDSATYRNKQLFSRCYVDVSLPNMSNPWRNSSVYLIVGGAGKIGLILAKDIINKTRGCQIILVGRSERSVNDFADAISYRQVDICHKPAVISLVQAIIHQYGKMTGVIHLAGVIRDSLLVNKYPDSIKQVLQPKVTGITNLDEATKDCHLDFFIAFSSFVSCLGNIGQTDYASANGFIDRYMAKRHERVENGHCYGHSCSLNWPLWDNGGMQVDEDGKDRFYADYGMRPISDGVALKAFYASFYLTSAQLLILSGDKEKLDNSFQSNQKQSADDSQAQSQSGMKSLQASLCQKLLHVFSIASKIPIADLNVDSPFWEYGIDSIMIVRINSILIEFFAEISKTLFYQYRTLVEVAQYLLQEHTSECHQWLALDRTSEVVETTVLGNSVKGSGTEDTACNHKEHINGSVAVIGMAGRYPMANTVNELWSNLIAGKDCISEIPVNRWDWHEHYNTDIDAAIDQHTSYSKWGGFVDRFDHFDSQFFHISPREALNIDPQERLFLQTCSELLEDACYTADLLRKYTVGVFVGVTKNGFEQIKNQTNKYFNPHTSFSSIANRVSYFFDFHGPSIAIDTMCSSSLVAVHQACEAIRNGACDLAIVGGVNLYLHPETYAYLSSLRMLSKTKYNSSFGEAGDGFVPGEGVGALLLKSEAAALKDNDRIDALLRASDINHGGRTSGYTVPNPNAHSQLIRSTLRKANIDASEISYVEAHGTGTSLGDPIEIAGLSNAFSGQSHLEPYCAIGSIKSNIGHLEAAAGIAGLTKVILQCKYKQLAPSLHVETINPNINFVKTPFKLQRTHGQWMPINNKYLAAISSFGAGGSNAHVIVEAYNNIEIHRSSENKNNDYLIVWSSHFEAGLHAYAKRLYQHIQYETFQGALKDVAYTLYCTRDKQKYRAAIIASNLEECVDKLKQFIQQEPVSVNELQTNSELEKLMQQWRRDKDADISSAFPENDFHRLSLPAHAFNDKQIWMTLKPSEQPTDNEQKIMPIEKKSKIILEALDAAVIEQKANTAVIVSANQPDDSYIADILASQLAELLFLNKNDVDYDLSFTDQGLDSIIGIEWINKINTEFSINAKVVKLYDYPCVRALEKWIQQQLPLPQSNISQSQSIQVSKSARQISLTVEVSVVMKTLQQQLAVLLFLSADDIMQDMPFVELGLDSITGVEWVARINETFKTTISVAKLYDYPTIRELSTFLESNLNLTDKPASHAQNVTQNGIRQSVESDSQRNTQYDDTENKIAIIGISGRYPGAKDTDEFWQNLRDGVDSISELPANRWDIKTHFDPQAKDYSKVYSKWLGALANIDEFDPSFFNITPLEATCMDPQQRLFMQEAWRAFEDAGYSSQALDNIKCGTYVGIMQNDYWQKVQADKQAYANAHTAIGNSSAIFAARLAYLLNLKGPAIAIDTACSSSAVSAYLACQALNAKEIDMALVGGATLYLDYFTYKRMCDAGMLSKHGKCFTFDKRADGFVPGEAVVTAVFKRLSDAVRDGDYIYGVIIGSGTNQDGKTNGITAPSAKSQAELEQYVYEKFNIDPSTISYIETHGTATQLGDPIEVEALNTSFQASQAVYEKGYCALGSVKSNVGHTSAAAGLVGLHKILLCMKHKELVPSINYQMLNPHIDLDNSPFYVNTEHKPWMINKGRRRAALSSFGFSGTNAHFVIEEYKQDLANSNHQSTTSQNYILPFSANTEQSLVAIMKRTLNYLSCISQGGTIYLSDIAHTLQCGRDAMKDRAICIASTIPELIELLNSAVKHALKPTRIYANSSDTLLNGLSQRWLSHEHVSWQDHFGSIGKRISLPTYCFEAEKYWIDPDISAVPNSTHQIELDKVEWNGHYLITRQTWQTAEGPNNQSASQPDMLILLVSIESFQLTQALQQNGYQFENITVSNENKSPESITNLFIKVFAKIKEALTARPILIIVPEDDYYIYSPLEGLVKSAQIEAPRYSKNMMSLPACLAHTDGLELIINERSLDNTDQVVRYDKNRIRRIKKAQTIETPPVDAEPIVSPHSVIWLTGGLGGLGKLFIQFFLQFNPKAIIVSGRSQESDHIRSQLEEISTTMTDVSYISCDLVDKHRVHCVLTEIRRKYTRLTGIVHAAGVLRDSIVLKKSEIEIQDVFKPKVAGILNIDEATINDPIEFLILCSSIAGYKGSMGQSDYSAANAFLDEFCFYRNELSKVKRRSGLTLSINWPFWSEGGMAIDDVSQAWIKRHSGLVPLATDDGINALHYLIANHQSGQYAVASGDQAKIKQYLNVSVASDTSLTDSQHTIEAALIELLESLLIVKKQDLSLDEDFSSYGIDSILMMKVLNELEDKYKINLSPSLLMEFPTIALLASHLKSIVSIDEPINLEQAQSETIERSLSAPNIHIPNISSEEHGLSGKIAIIAQSCRLPQSADASALWDNLLQSMDCITDVPVGRFGKHLDDNYSCKGGYIDGLENFDSEKFGIDAEDALTIDPQHRLVLELVSELLEYSQYTKQSINGKNVGVYLGAKENNYLRNSLHLIPSSAQKHIIVNSIGNMIAARTSDYYNLRGPSKVIDTACSSSLVSIHDACQSILHGECDMAIAGGVYLLVDSFPHYGFHKAGVLSPDAKSFVFDQRANGLVLSEGAGLLLLKPYEAAVRDNDEILSVIMGSAVNNDGHTMGLTVPNKAGQKEVIQEALTRAEIDPSQISYYEAHGTGTLLGDPIEVRAATELYKNYTDKTQYCAIGSVKSNIGHTMTAAGIAGLIKINLCIKNQMLVPTLHCDIPHPRFNFEKSPFYPNTELKKWQSRSNNRIAAISSFGFGGTNCHMIVKEVS